MTAHTDHILDTNQSAGAVTLDLSAYRAYRHHEIAVEVSSGSAAGTLDISRKLPGATGYNSVGTITFASASALSKQFDGSVDEFKFTPTSYPAGETYSVYLVSLP